MRICLQCDSEFVDAPALCRSCGARTSTMEEAELYRSLRERMRTEDLVVVTTLEGPVDEAILGRLLFDAGIVFAIHGGGGTGPFPGVDQGAGLDFGTLMVLEDQLAHASDIVRHYRAAVVTEGATPDEG